ncbi:hypothetical protein NCS57_00777500 [Fusarium keratoplasticum]|uniref:Uncharacterized protein n=1 Tax=Fusarium keratoplasticum TaxID=1328300 RepID=A0ACC0QZP2_9HYPO|nr:hypothetical protein NCS57_00777500 [Fusarium keratoplasticum]KAI8669621.1 hypothetical protein NCS57_00777500 [Fusarium keratoplasticum]
MAEALGIASGVAGIVSLGITVCSGLDTFFSAIKDRDDDLKRATELLALLRRYIELIRPSASTLSSRHAQATDLVVLALRSCEGELRALKELVDNLNTVDGASDVARKWDKSKSIITYPFQRKKLTQIQDQLLKATGALGTVIQPLILHVGVGVGDDIEAFRSAVQDNHLVTTAFLTRLESKVERIEGSAQQTEARLTAISTGVEEQKTLASSSQTLIKDTGLMVSGKLDAIAEGLWLGPQSQTVGTAQQREIPRYLRNSMIERKCIQETAMEICPCEGKKSGKGRQPVTTYRFWGGLTISYQATFKGDHQPGCCFYKRSTKTTITYTGLRFLLSKVLSFSLQRDYQCGGSLTTHSLRTYNVRETSQAFDVFEYSDDWMGRRHFTSCMNGRGEVDITRVAQDHIKKLQIAYTSGKASPLDVDKFGYNVAHLCIPIYSYLMATIGKARKDHCSEGLKMMLLFLQRVGVNVYAGTDYDSSMIEFIFRKREEGTLASVYDVLANCDSQFDLEQDHESRGTFTPNGFFIDALRERPDVMEGLGYRNLFLAVAKQDEARLKELIQNIRFVEYVRETDFFGRNVLHFCSNWETGLRLLLEKEATHRLVNQPDETGYTPLTDATRFSGCACQESYALDLCSGCSCSATVKLLLETDCPLGLGLINEWLLFRPSMKARIALLEHLAQRRERLQRLALNHLPESELRDLGVSLNELPDMTAPAIWDRLQSLHQRGAVKVLHNGLDPLAGHVQRGIFHLLKHPRDAEVALNLGFKGIDTPNRDGVTPVLWSAYKHGPRNRFEYADWLIQKGARLEYCVNSLGISAAHGLARCCGEWVRDEFSKSRRTAQSRLPCPCATEELSLPLHHLVDFVVFGSLDRVGGFLAPRFSYADSIAKVVYLVDLFSHTISDLHPAYLFKSIIHALTMRFLHIRSHLQWCHEFWDAAEETVQRIKEATEWDEILGKDRARIKRLGELTEEFEQEFSNQNVSIKDFLQLHWLPRMRQVGREGETRLRRRRELRELGVPLRWVD